MATQGMFTSGYRLDPADAAIVLEAWPADQPGPGRPLATALALKVAGGWQGSSVRRAAKAGAVARWCLAHPVGLDNEKGDFGDAASGWRLRSPLEALRAYANGGAKPSLMPSVARATRPTARTDWRHCLRAIEFKVTG